MLLAAGGPRWAFAGAALVVVTTSTAYTVLIEASKIDAGFKYSYLVFLFLTCVAKAGASLVLFRLSRGRHASGSSAAAAAAAADVFTGREFLRYIVSAALYAINDVFVFVVMSRFDNVSYSLLVTGKIAVVALLTRTVLKRVLTSVQYASFVVLAVAMVVNQYRFCEESVNHDKLVGYLIVAAAELVGGIAGIMNEFVMKSAPQQSLHFQNFNLYLASMVIYLPLIVLEDWERLRDGTPLHDFSVFVWAMLPVNALRGLCISVLYRVSTNMTKIFVISVAMLANGILGDVLFGYTLDTQFAL